MGKIKKSKKSLRRIKKSNFNKKGGSLKRKNRKINKIKKSKKTMNKRKKKSKGGTRKKLFKNRRLIGGSAAAELFRKIPTLSKDDREIIEQAVKLYETLFPRENIIQILYRGSLPKILTHSDAMSIPGRINSIISSKLEINVIKIEAKSHIHLKLPFKLQEIYSVFFKKENLENLEMLEKLDVDNMLKIIDRIDLNSTDINYLIKIEKILLCFCNNKIYENFGSVNEATAVSDQRMIIIGKLKDKIQQTRTTVFDKIKNLISTFPSLNQDLFSRLIPLLEKKDPDFFTVYKKFKPEDIDLDIFYRYVYITLANHYDELPKGQTENKQSVLMILEKVRTKILENAKNDYGFRRKYKSQNTRPRLAGGVKYDTIADLSIEKQITLFSKKKSVITTDNEIDEYVYKGTNDLDLTPGTYKLTTIIGLKMNVKTFLEFLKNKNKNEIYIFQQLSDDNKHDFRILIKFLFFYHHELLVNQGDDLRLGLALRLYLADLFIKKEQQKFLGQSPTSGNMVVLNEQVFPPGIIITEIKKLINSSDLNTIALSKFFAVGTLTDLQKRMIIRDIVEKLYNLKLGDNEMIILKNLIDNITGYEELTAQDIIDYFIAYNTGKCFTELGDLNTYLNRNIETGFLQRVATTNPIPGINDAQNPNGALPLLLIFETWLKQICAGGQDDGTLLPIHDKVEFQIFCEGLTYESAYGIDQMREDGTIYTEFQEVETLLNNEGSILGYCINNIVAALPDLWLQSFGDVISTLLHILMPANHEIYKYYDNETTTTDTTGDRDLRYELEDIRDRLKRINGLIKTQPSSSGKALSADNTIEGRIFTGDGKKINGELNLGVEFTDIINRLSSINPNNRVEVNSTLVFIRNFINTFKRVTLQIVFYSMDSHVSFNTTLPRNRERMVLLTYGSLTDGSQQPPFLYGKTTEELEKMIVVDDLISEMFHIINILEEIHQNIIALIGFNNDTHEQKYTARYESPDVKEAIKDGFDCYAETNGDDPALEPEGKPTNDIIFIYPRRREQARAPPSSDQQNNELQDTDDIGSASDTGEEYGN